MSSYFCVGWEGDTEGGVKEGGGCFFSVLSAYLFTSFHFSSIKSACMFVGVLLVCCGSLLVTLLWRRTPSTWAESQASCDCAWALICQVLIPQRRRDVSLCLLALPHISMWHVNMSQRIKCCSWAFLLPKYLHAALCVCVCDRVSGRETCKMINWSQFYEEDD